MGCASVKTLQAVELQVNTREAEPAVEELQACDHNTREAESVVVGAAGLRPQHSGGRDRRITELGVSLVHTVSS